MRQLLRYLLNFESLYFPSGAIILYRFNILSPKRIAVLHWVCTNFPQKKENINTTTPYKLLKFHE